MESLVIETHSVFLNTLCILAPEEKRIGSKKKRYGRHELSVCDMERSFAGRTVADAVAILSVFR